MLAGKVGVAPGTITMFYPYGIDYRGAGLGVIDPTDFWPTGRPYGLPGTATLRVPGLGGAEFVDEFGQAEAPWYKSLAFVGAASAIGGGLLGFLAGFAMRRR